jgi:hypothetical protein
MVFAVSPAIFSAAVSSLAQAQADARQPTPRPTLPPGRPGSRFVRSFTSLRNDVERPYVIFAPMSIIRILLGKHLLALLTQLVGKLCWLLVSSERFDGVGMFFGHDNARKCEQASDYVREKKNHPCAPTSTQRWFYRGNGSDGGRISRWNIARPGDSPGRFCMHIDVNARMDKVFWQYRISCYELLSGGSTFHRCSS